ncbi:TonB family protein [Desulfolithobacter sp.]
MSKTAQRLLAAAILALTLHGILLGLKLSQSQTPAEPLAVQRIAISIGAGKIAEPKPAEQPKPYPPAPVSEPKPAPMVQPEKRGEPVAEKKKKSAIKKQIRKEQPAPVQPRAKKQAVLTQPSVPHQKPVEGKATPEELTNHGPGTETEDENSQADPVAARVIQKATPLYKVNPPPEYPRLARRRGLEGTVLLEVLVDRDGRVRTIRVHTSSGHSILDRAALKSVRTWRFNPGTIDGQPSDMLVQVPVRFQLK